MFAVKPAADDPLTHKSPFKALPGFPNFRRSLILAGRSLDWPPKVFSEGNNWDFAVDPTLTVERQVAPKPANPT
jgi:hypothetical protein